MLNYFLSVTLISTLHPCSNFPTVNVATLHSMPRIFTYETREWRTIQHNSKARLFAKV